MKIALLGAKETGKTAYFTGLYARYRNTIAFRPGRPRRRSGVAADLDRELLGFKIGLDNDVAEAALALRTDGFFKTPVKFGGPTVDLNEVTIAAEFAFQTAARSQGLSLYNRDFEIADPPGGAFRGEGDRTPATISKLAACDAYLLFLDGEKVQEASTSRNGAEMLGHSGSLGKIRDLIEGARKKADEGDIIPICVVISKFDVFGNRVTAAARKLVYDQVVLPLSLYSTNYVICVCPASVLDRKRNEFSPYNLDWPFVFCTAATIFRNAFTSRASAEEQSRKAEEMDDHAREVQAKGWFGRLKSFLGGSGVNASRRRAESYRTASGRLVTSAVDDEELARRLWNQIASRGDDFGVRVYMDGHEVDPRTIADLHVA